MKLLTSAKQNIDSVVFATASFFVILLITSHGGIGISSDSIVYTSVARNIHHHLGIVDYNQRPLVDFPLFYPVFLSSVIYLTSFDPTVFGHYLNGLLFAIIIYVCGCIINHFNSGSKYQKRLLLLSIVVSPSLLQVYSMLWSETLFIALVLCFVITIYHYFQHHKWWVLIGAALLIGVSVITRYAGISMIAAGSVLLLFDKGLTFLKRIYRLLLFAIVSSLFFILNILYNRSFTGTLTGARLKSVTPFLANVGYYGEVLSGWLTPINFNNTVCAIIGSIVILLMLTALIFSFKKSIHFSLPQILTVVFIIYVSFIVLSATFSRFEKINNRLLAPAFIPLVLAGSFWTKQWLKATFTNKKNILIVATTLYLVFQGNQLYRSVKMNNQVTKEGIEGYNQYSWKKSDIANWLRLNGSQFKRDHTNYSNASEALYFFGGLKGDMLPSTPQEIEDFKTEDYIYLIWFNSARNPVPYPRDYFLSLKKMTLWKHFADGDIYVFETDEE